MAQTDILLEQDRVRVVDVDGSEGDGGTERGEVQLTAEANARRPRGTGRVWINGGTGQIQLASGQDSGTGDPTIELDGGPGRIRAANGIQVGGEKEGVGSGGGTGGVSLGSSRFTGGVNLYAEPPESESERETGDGDSGSLQESGVVELHSSRGSKTVDIQGESATLRLGWDPGKMVPEVEEATEEMSVADPPVGPTIKFPDGGTQQEAASGSIVLTNPNGNRTKRYGIEAGSNSLRITIDNTLVFEVDPSGSIRIPEGWSIEKDLPAPGGSSGSSS
jgi:hypothetical protein